MTRQFQFRLRTLFIAIALIAFFIAYTGWWWRRAETERQRAEQAIEAAMRERDRARHAELHAMDALGEVQATNERMKAMEKALSKAQAE